MYLEKSSDFYEYNGKGKSRDKKHRRHKYSVNLKSNEMCNTSVTVNPKSDDMCTCITSVSVNLQSNEMCITSVFVNPKSDYMCITSVSVNLK